MSPAETWLLVLVKVDGAVVMYLGPVIVAAGLSTGPAAAAVDTGAAMAIALRTTATRTRRARVGFLANLALALRCVELPGQYSNILNSNRCLGMYGYDPFTAADGSASGGPQGLASFCVALRAASTTGAGPAARGGHSVGRTRGAPTGAAVSAGPSVGGALAPGPCANRFGL
jgi:hypothetical protein